MLVIVYIYALLIQRDVRKKNGKWRAIYSCSWRRNSLTLGFIVRLTKATIRWKSRLPVARFRNIWWCKWRLSRGTFSIITLSNYGRSSSMASLDLYYDRSTVFWSCYCNNGETAPQVLAAAGLPSCRRNNHSRTECANIKCWTWHLVANRGLT